MKKLTQQQHQQNQLNMAQNREQEQLVGYWAKSKGFSKQQLDKSTADVELLQAVRLATNIIKNVPRQHREVYRDCNDLLGRYRKGHKVSSKLMQLVFRHTQRISRQQAKKARKATR